jgi:hypothetical protein
MASAMTAMQKEMKDWAGQEQEIRRDAPHMPPVLTEEIETARGERSSKQHPEKTAHVFSLELRWRFRRLRVWRLRLLVAHLLAMTAHLFMGHAAMLGRVMLVRRAALAAMSLHHGAVSHHLFVAHAAVVRRTHRGATAKQSEG